MSKATKLKEAIKTGLAFTLVFGIAMHLGWMNPLLPLSWEVFAQDAFGFWCDMDSSNECMP